MRFLALLVFVSANVLAQSSDTTSRIDKLFSSWNNATPGMSVLVARGDQVLYHKAFGLADLERTVPITTNTVFEAGSVSKQFTAISILLLESEGKLKLTDDVRKYIPELPVYEAPITIQQLLNHTSGLKDWGSAGSLTGWPRGQRNYTLDLGLHIICKQKTTNYKPGTEYNYSNSNYTLQVVIIERVSNQRFEDFTRERLFEPLGMTSTRWRSNFRDVVPGRALAYGPRNGKYELDMVFENIHGHGGLLTTTGDLLKWNRILETHQIGGDAVYNKRIERGKLANGEVLQYAAGLGYGDVNGVVEIGHTGSTAGYRAWLGYYPSKKITVAMLSNDASFASYDIAQGVGEIFFGKKEDTGDHEEMPEQVAVDKPMDQHNYDYTGRFYSEDAECSFTIVKKNNDLVAINDAQEEITLIRDDRHMYTFNGRSLVFKVDKKKNVTGFDVSMGNARNIPFKKISK